MNENQMCSIEHIFSSSRDQNTTYNVINDSTRSLNTTINVHLGVIQIEIVHEGRQKSKNLPFPGIPI